MTHELRKRHILQMLDKNEAVNIKEIANRCNVSEITARRDLVVPEQKGINVLTI